MSSTTLRRSARIADNDESSSSDSQPLSRRELARRRRSAATPRKQHLVVVEKDDSFDVMMGPVFDTARRVARLKARQSALKLVLSSGFVAYSSTAEALATVAFLPPVVRQKDDANNADSIGQATVHNKKGTI